MAGRCPSELEADFIADCVAGLTNKQLSKKYGRGPRAMRSWKQRLRQGGKLNKEHDVPNRKKSEWTEDGNYAEWVLVTEDRVRSFEELCDAFNIDLTKWKKIFFECGTWEGYAKKEDKDLYFDQGVISGHAKSKGLIVTPLYRTKARFIRLEPVALHPVIKPVECKVTYSRPPKPEIRGVYRALVGGDQHFGYTKNPRTGKLEPFHDRKALDLFLQIAAYIQPDLIVLGGDTQDFPNMQDRFLRDPSFDQTTQPSLEESYWHLSRLRQACRDTRIVMEPGNHEDRMRKATLTHFKAAYELRAADELELPPALSPEKLMGLDGLGIEWIGDYPNGEHWLHDGLRVIHGATAKQAPGATARGIVEGSDVSTIFFHIHRRELVSRTLYTRNKARTLTAFSPGCLCRIDGVVPGTKQRQNWQQGMAIIDYTSSQQSSYIIEIHDGVAIWDGKLFEGNSEIEQLRSDKPEWNW